MVCCRGAAVTCLGFGVKGRIGATGSDRREAAASQGSLPEKGRLWDKNIPDKARHLQGLCRGRGCACLAKDKQRSSLAEEDENKGSGGAGEKLVALAGLGGGRSFHPGSGGGEVPV